VAIICYDLNEPEGIQVKAGFQAFKKEAEFKPLRKTTKTRLFSCAMAVDLTCR